MSINTGTKIILTAGILILFTTSCDGSKQLIEETVSLEHNATDRIENLDVESLVSQAESHISAHLGSPVFQGIFFTTSCESFPYTSGNAVIAFAQRRNGYLYPKSNSLYGDVVLNLESGVSELEISSTHNADTIGITKPLNHEFNSAVILIHKYLESNSLYPCRLEIFQEGKTWGFGCWGEIQCKGIVDLINTKIVGTD